MYIYIYMYTYTHTYKQTYIHTYIHTYMRAHMHAHMHTHMHVYIHTCIHTNIHAYIHTYIHTCIHTHALCFSVNVRQKNRDVCKNGGSRKGPPSGKVSISNGLTKSCGQVLGFVETRPTADSAVGTSDCEGIFSFRSRWQQSRI